VEGVAPAKGRTADDTGGRGSPWLRRMTSGASAGLWRWPALIAAGLGLGLICLLAILRAGIPGTTTYVGRAQLVFDGVQDGQYPNKGVFALNQIIQPAVLERVYTELELQKYGLKQSDYFNYFSVVPFAPSAEGLVARFRAKIEDRRLTGAERTELEGQLGEQLSKLSRSGAQVTFSIDSTVALPENIGQQIVPRVFQVWAKNQIDSQGVLSLPGAVVSDVLIGPNVESQFEFSVAVDRLWDAVQAVRGRITALEVVPNARVVADPKTGLSISDVEREIDILQSYYVRPIQQAVITYRFSDDNTQAKIYFDGRLRDIEADTSRIDQDAQSIKVVIDSYVTSSSGTLGAGATLGTGPGGASSIPQLSESFIDRIISMSERGAELKFVEEMSRTRLQLMQRKSKNQERELRLQAVVAALAGSTPPVPEKLRATTLQHYRSASVELDRLWATLNGIYRAVSARNLDLTGRLYTPLITDKPVERSHPVLSTGLLLLLAPFLISVFLLLWLFRILLSYRMREA
jgi:hypothetical protein